MKTGTFLTGALLPALLLSLQVQAVTQPVVAYISFATPLTVTKGSDINFGWVLAAQPADYIISPAGAVTASRGGRILGGGGEGGSLLIAGSPDQTVDISIGNYMPDAGVVPSAATCSYGGAPSVPCRLVSQAAPGAGRLLRVGATVSVDGSQKSGAHAAPSFDVIVNYH
ncbi:MAG: DUF4402 domain-containing protein [Bdellovibrionales bacterium]